MPLFSRLADYTRILERLLNWRLASWLKSLSILGHLGSLSCVSMLSFLLFLCDLLENIEGSATFFSFSSLTGSACLSSMIRLFSYHSRINSSRSIPNTTICFLYLSIFLACAWMFLSNLCLFSSRPCFCLLFSYKVKSWWMSCWMRVIC